MKSLHVVARHSHNNQELYIFQSGEKKVGLIFWYNGNNKFTKTQIANNHTNDTEFAALIKSKFDQPVNVILTESNFVNTDEAIGSQDSKAENLFDDKHKAHQILYTEINGILGKMQITIETIEHLQYQEIYNLKRGREVASIQFYYDGLDRFTSAQPLINKCNSNELLLSVNEAIVELAKI